MFRLMGVVMIVILVVYNRKALVTKNEKAS